LEGAWIMVTIFDYPDGYPLFTYQADGRVSTVCLTHPKDGSAPPPLTILRDNARREIEKQRTEGKSLDPFLEQTLEALEKLISALRQSPSV
jgi:hypothetical protein